MADAKNIKLAPLRGTWLLNASYPWVDADSRAKGMSPETPWYVGGWPNREARKFFEQQWKEWCAFAPISRIFVLENAGLEPLQPVQDHVYVDPAVPGECFSEDVFAELSLELSDLM